MHTICNTGKMQKCNNFEMHTICNTGKMQYLKDAVWLSREDREARVTWFCGRSALPARSSSTYNTIQHNTIQYNTPVLCVYTRVLCLYTTLNRTQAGNTCMSLLCMWMNTQLFSPVCCTFVHLCWKRLRFFCILWMAAQLTSPVFLYVLCSYNVVLLRCNHLLPCMYWTGWMEHS